MWILAAGYRLIAIKMKTQCKRNDKKERDGQREVDPKISKPMSALPS